MLLVFGVAVGTMSGLLGIGGGIVIVPGLVFLFGLSQSEAQGTSLAVLALRSLLLRPSSTIKRVHSSDERRCSGDGFCRRGVRGGASPAGGSSGHHPPLFGCLLVYVGILFMLDGQMKPTRAALPAGIAAFVSFLVADFYVPNPSQPREIRLPVHPSTISRRRF